MVDVPSRPPRLTGACRQARMQYKSPLLQSLQSNLRLQHLSRRTETAYIYWTKRFVRFYGLRHPLELGDTEVRRFLTHLVVERNLSAATQQQALSALLFPVPQRSGPAPRSPGASAEGAGAHHVAGGAHCGRGGAGAGIPPGHSPSGGVIAIWQRAQGNRVSTVTGQGSRSGAG